MPNDNLTPESLAALKAAVDDSFAGEYLHPHLPTIRALLEEREQKSIREAKLREAWWEEAKAAGAREAYKAVREAIDTCEVHKPMDDSWAPVHRRAVAMMRSILDAVENPGPVTDAREREAQS